MKKKCKNCYFHSTLQLEFDWNHPFQYRRKEIVCKNEDNKNSSTPDALTCNHFLSKTTKEWQQEMGDYTKWMHQQELQKYVFGLRNSFIRFFGLKGSWKWASKQMRNGNIVRCKHWAGTLMLKIDNNENTLLKCSFSTELPYKWETSNCFLDYELYTDYIVVDDRNR